MKPKSGKQNMGADLPLSAVGALASGDGAVEAGVKVGLWAHAQGLRLVKYQAQPESSLSHK